MDRSRLASWLQRLVRIPSVSPDQAGPRAGQVGEAAIAAAVAGWFGELGGEVHVVPVHPGRPNVFGIWPGRSSRWLAVDIHVDTVGVEQMEGDPFDGRVADGRVYGRGAVDTKASLAVALALLQEMAARGQTPAANLLIAATVDEETGASGAPAAAAWLQQRQLTIDQLLVAEPTGCAPIYGHKGVVRLCFQVTGQPAHSSQPHLGRNAVTAAAHLAVALEAEHGRLQALPPQTELGLPTLTVTMMRGGTGINVVPDSCQLYIDRRVVAGEDPVVITVELQELAARACPQPLTTQIMRQIQAFYQPPQSEWLQQLQSWAGRPTTVAPYGTNAWAYPQVARERVVLGPGSIDQAHGAVEWVEIAELEKLAAIYSRWWGLA